ncbi:MTAP family purine nucleoside phosphorylase [Myxococcaceae bacterium GXIMD 01537]
MTRRLAFISGSGLDALWERYAATPLDTATPHGAASDGLREVTLDGHRVVVLPRHASGHRLPPHRINHRANLSALRQHGVTDVVSLSTTGSLRWGLRPGSFVVPLDFFDCTRQVVTVFDDEVRHTSMQAPFDGPLSRLLHAVVKERGRCRLGGVYVGISGPRYPTRAEVRFYKQYGDIIGMTVVPEVVLANELGLRYANCSLVTDNRLDVSHAQVVANAARHQHTLTESLPRLVARFAAAH